jgi:hypothetical protein
VVRGHCGLGGAGGDGGCPFGLRPWALPPRSDAPGAPPRPAPRTLPWPGSPGFLNRGGRGLEPGVAGRGHQPDAHGPAAAVDRPDPDDPEGGGADETLVQQLAGEDQVQVLKARGLFARL